MSEYSLAHPAKYKSKANPTRPRLGLLPILRSLVSSPFSVSCKASHSVLNMSSISRAYAEVFNSSCILIGHEDVFLEIRKYHQQDLMDDEVLVSLHKSSDAPV